MSPIPQDPPDLCLWEGVTAICSDECWGVCDHMWLCVAGCADPVPSSLGPALPYTNASSCLLLLSSPSPTLCSHGNYPSQGVSVTSWGPGGVGWGSGQDLWLCIFLGGRWGEWCPSHTACISSSLTPKALCLRGSVTHSSHPLLGLSALFTRDGEGKRFPQVLAPTE